MDPSLPRIARRAAARFIQSDAIGDPQDWAAEFERAVKMFVEGVPQSQLDAVKAYMTANPDAKMSREGMEFDSMAGRAFFSVKLGHQRIQSPGHKLFLSILQSFTLPPALRKKVEIASRLYMKDLNPRLKSREFIPRMAEKVAAFETYRDLLQSHILIAREALAKGRAHEEEGETATKIRVGPFTLVNTGGFDEKVLGEVADVMQKATALAQSAGFGKVCYGDVQVTNTISKARTLAFYLLANDEMFVRANVKASADTVRTVLHELGHRYEHKFLNNPSGVARLYRVLDGQEMRRRFDFEKARARLPEIGETLESKGKTYVVTHTLPDARTGYKIHLALQTNATQKATISLEGWLEMKGEEIRDVAEPDYIGFVTDYARRGGPSENFAEMFALYCLGRLPKLQRGPFEELIFGHTKTARIRERVLARFSGRSEPR